MHDTQNLDGWQLDGDSAEAYERFLVPAFFATWASELIDFADVRLGCAGSNTTSRTRC